MSNLLLQAFDAPVRPEIQQVNVGDSVTLFYKVNVGTKNERAQMVRGLVIAKGGRGNNAFITIRRIAPGGVGVELTYRANSPRIENVEIQRSGKVRRAKLYYMRGRTGKSARLREKTSF